MALRRESRAVSAGLLALTALTLTVLFLVGLVSIGNSLRGWSDDPAIRPVQSIFVVTIGAGGMPVMTINRIINPPRTKRADDLFTEDRATKEVRDFDP